MAIQKSLLIALENDYVTAVRTGNKDKAIAAFSALVGIAIAVESAQARALYNLLTNITTVSPAQMTIDKNAVVALIARNL